jgi:hypothetical protein
MRKLCTNEIKKGQNEEKHLKRILQFEKTYIFYCSFFVVPLALHFKDDL